MSGSDPTTRFAVARRTVAIAAVACGLAVALGAFGAHGLKDALLQWYPPAEAPRMMENWQTGVRYQMWHGLALLGMSGCLAAGVVSAGTIRGVALCLVGGMVLFSGSLYVLVLSGARVMGMVVPVGGLLFLAGWVWCWLGVIGSGRPSS